MVPRTTALLGLLALAGCGERVPTPAENQAFARNLENIAAPQKAPEPQEPPGPNLVPLQAADQAAALGAAPACAFALGDRILFAAAGRQGVARVNGLSVRFAGELPAGATGGFFESERFSISVGRLADAGVAVERTTSWPARLLLTDRSRAGAEQRLEGAWRCPTPEG